MPVESLRYIGINRAVSDYSQSSACEELINLRPSNDGLVPVLPFTEKYRQFEHDTFFVHDTVDGPMPISIVVGEEDGVYTIKVYLYNEDDPVELGTLEFANEVNVEDVHFATAGNMFLISVYNKENGSIGNRAFLWNGEEYKKVTLNVPTIDVTPSLSGSMCYSQNGISWSADPQAKEIAARVVNGLNEIVENNENVCFGPIIVAVAFKTKDGETFWTGQWQMITPIPTVRTYTGGATGNNSYYLQSLYAGSLLDNNTDNQELAAAISNAHHILPEYLVWLRSGYVQGQTWVDEGKVRLAGATVNLALAWSSGNGWNEGESVVESVEIYSSRPEPYYYEEESIIVTANKNAGAMLLKPRNYSAMELDKQLLYHQASIPLRELKNSTKTITLKFGGNKQTTNTTLKVDAGRATRYGNVMGYNARFHFFDSLKVTDIRPMFYYHEAPAGTQTRAYAVFLTYVEGAREELLRIPNVTYFPNPSYLKTIIAPSQNVTKVSFYLTDSPNKLYTFTMRPSEKYNYAIYSGDSGDFDYTESSNPISPYSGITIDEIKNFVSRKEQNAINVSNQYNPFVFDVRHSYATPANILSIQPQLVGMSDTSYGTYPVSVFTERGVYALRQGNGEVLYSELDPTPVSNLKLKSNALSTDSGIFFLAEGGLWLLAGSRAVLVSAALDGWPHRFIETSAGYQSLHNASGSAEVVSSLVSSIPFLQFIEGAKLTYNPYRDEIYISNPAKYYSYALSIRYRQWFKIVGQFTQHSAKDILVLRDSDSIVDLSSENTTPAIHIHLQTRPFSIGYQYSHIHRIVAMIRTALINSQSSGLAVSLHGSDDLQNWTMLSYAFRTRSAQSSPAISQVRLAPSARSWRYYTICIGGYVDKATDIGPILVDYAPVKRRIG